MLTRSRSASTCARSAAWVPDCMTFAAPVAMATGAANVMQSGTQAAERAQVDALLDRVSIESL